MHYGLGARIYIISVGKKLTTICSRKDSLNDSVLTSEQVNVIRSNEILEQIPLNDGANVANSDSNKEALYQVMKLLNIPKRTVTTQVDLVRMFCKARKM